MFIIVFYSGRNHQLVLMLAYLHSLKLCSHKILILQQGPESHHLKQVSKKQTKKPHQHWDKLTSCTSWYIALRRKQFLWYSWTNMHILSWIIRKHQTNPKWRPFYNTVRLYSLKKSVNENETFLRNFFRLKETKEILHLNVRTEIFFCSKLHCWYNW